jgi:hypothetical protein
MSEDLLSIETLLSTTIHGFIIVLLVAELP